MRRTWAVAAAALYAAMGLACTSVRMVQRDGCWLKQTEKWPSRVNEELAFCHKPAPVWSQDPLARLVQECVAQADYRWETRAILAFTQGEAIPAHDSDEKTTAACMTEAAAALGPEAERAALKSRLADLDKDRESLKHVADSDRQFFQQSNDRMATALGEAAKKPPPAAVATATSTGTATTDSELRSAHEGTPGTPPTTVVGFNAPAPATPVVIAPVTAQPAAPAARVAAPARPAAASRPCAAQRKTAVDKAARTTEEPADCEKAPAPAPIAPRAG